MKSRYKSIGRKIKEVREFVGLSQRQLAETIGFETSTAISLIESGERRVSISDLEKIAEVLNKNVGYFLGQEEKTNLNYALRAEKGLSSKDKEMLSEFIEVFKNKHGKRNK